MENQTNLVIAGFFRTGNTFLETCIESMYKDVKCISLHEHSVIYLSKQVEQKNNIIVPIRNPIDTVASFYEFKKFLNRKDAGVDIDLDIKFYTRYMNYVYENFDNILCLDFDIFTKNLDYISNLISKKFKIEKTNNADLDLINEYMERNKKMFFNKRNEYLPDLKIKEDALNLNEAQEAIEIYSKIKEKMEKNNV
jgi:hypothetical protein